MEVLGWSGSQAQPEAQPAEPAGQLRLAGGGVVAPGRHRIACRPEGQAIAEAMVVPAAALLVDRVFAAAVGGGGEGPGAVDLELHLDGGEGRVGIAGPASGAAGRVDAVEVPARRVGVDQAEQLPSAPRVDPAAAELLVHRLAAGSEEGAQIAAVRKVVVDERIGRLRPVVRAARVGNSAKV